MKRLLILAVALLLPASAWAQAQLTTSWASRVNTPDYIEVQLVRCDNAGAIAGNNGPRTGEACIAGDWTKPLDCRGFTDVSIRYHEYSAGGNSTLKVWDCLNVPGPPGTVAVMSTLGGSVPGFEPPVNPPSAADPDPLCVSLDDTVGATIDGVNPGTQLVNISGQTLHYLIGEIDTCVNCDSTAVLSCSR